MVKKQKDLSDVVEEAENNVEKSRRFYKTLTSRERSLIRACRERYHGRYDRFIGYLRARIKNHPTVKEVVDDIQSLRRIKNFERRYQVRIYGYTGSC